MASSLSRSLMRATAAAAAPSCASAGRPRGLASDGHHFRSPRPTMPHTQEPVVFDRYHWDRAMSTKANEEPSTVSEDEVSKFRRMAELWWNRAGPCKPLHSLNRLRVQLVREGLQATGSAKKDCPQPLEGLRILDVGCGGGLFSEPLARLGAEVTALDAAAENVSVARAHALEDRDISTRLNYVHTTVEAFAASREPSEPLFDAVVSSEVLEHVEQQPLFVQKCIDLTRRGGSVFFTTINRTHRSYLAGIVAAECILGLVPVGTHDWNKFVTPEELDAWLGAGGCQLRLAHGMFYVPVLDRWMWVPDSAVNYAIHAVKE